MSTNNAGIGRRQWALLAALFLVGLGFLGVAAYRSFGHAFSRQPSDDLAGGAREYLRHRKPAALSESLQKLLTDPSGSLALSHNHPLLSEPAPPFELPDHRGRPWKLEERLTRGPVVVIFYLGYTCNHCVSQLFDVNEDIARFKELGAQVVAISPDPPELTQERFKQYGAFAFPVLSDPGSKVAEKYGVFTPADGKEPEDLRHGTFVIGQEGRVRWAQTGPEPFTGNRTLLYELARLQGRLPGEQVD